MKEYDLSDSVSVDITERIIQEYQLKVRIAA